jgi:hypothetical protein
MDELSQAWFDQLALDLAKTCQFRTYAIAEIALEALTHANSHQLVKRLTPIIQEYLDNASPATTEGQ